MPDIDYEDFCDGYEDVDPANESGTWFDDRWLDDDDLDVLHSIDVL